jgi:hypothetical protein
MNEPRQTATRTIGFLMGTALLGTLAGCASYVDQPNTRGGYYQEAPAPREVVYVQPPAVQAEASGGSVGVPTGVSVSSPRAIRLRRRTHFTEPVRRSTVVRIRLPPIAHTG